MSALNSICLLDSSGSNYACCFPPKELACPSRDRESYVRIRTGTRPTEARVWMTQSQYAALPTPNTRFFGIQMTGQANAYPATLNSPSGSNTTLTFCKAADEQSFFIGEVRVAKASINGEALLELKLYTFQQQWAYDTGVFYCNILNGPDPRWYVAGSADDTGGNPTLYQDFLNTVADEYGLDLTLPFTPKVNPQNFSSVSNPYGEVLERLLRPIACQVVFDPTQNPSVFSVVQLSYTNTSETTDLTNLASCVAVDGSTAQYVENSPDAGFYPSNVTVAFPYWPLQPPSAGTNIAKYDMTNGPYNNPASNGVGTEILFVGDQYSYASGAQVLFATNSASLSDIANERQQCYWGRRLIKDRTWLFAGGYPIIPGQTIREVYISMDGPSTFSNGGWYTMVKQHGNYEGVYDICRRDNKAPNFPIVGQYLDQVQPRDDGTIDPSPPGYDIFPINITGTNTAGTNSAFNCVPATPSNGVMVSLPGGTSMFAIEMNGLNVPANLTFYLAEQQYDTKLMQNVLVFNAQPGCGTLQFQVYQMTGGTTTGWDYCRAH